MTITINHFEGLAEKFRAIGHPARVAIINLLCNCGCSRMTVKDIYETLGLDQPGTSRHLNIMRQCGILKREQVKGEIFYRLSNQDQHVKCIKKCFNG